MLVALALVFAGCLGMYFANSFWGAKLMFLSVGVSFALIKLSVYSLVGVVTSGPRQHAALMSSIEGFFMVGIASAYFLFPAFYDDANERSWLNVYLLLCVLIFISILFLLFSGVRIPKQTVTSDWRADIKNSLALLTLPLVLVFICAAFFFVMIEQGIMTWLPRFNEKIFSFSEVLSVQMASLLAISLAAGRFIAGWLAKRISWSHIVIACALASGGLLLIVLPAIRTSANLGQLTSVLQVPAIGFALPFIGLFIAPIYPLLNSTVLSHLPKNLHAPMSGLIIIFSALGGTLGSRMVGILFGRIGGVNAFYFLIIPLLLLVVAVLLIRKITSKAKPD